MKKIELQNFKQQHSLPYNSLNIHSSTDILREFSLFLCQICIRRIKSEFPDPDPDTRVLEYPDILIRPWTRIWTVGSGYSDIRIIRIRIQALLVTTFSVIPLAW